LRYFLLVPFSALQARRSGSFDVCPQMPPIGLRYLKAIYDPTGVFPTDFHQGRKRRILVEGKLLQIYVPFFSVFSLFL
jgi:hypothetical protein